MASKRERYTPTDIGPTPQSWRDPRLSELSFFISNGFVGTATPYYASENTHDAVKYLYGTNVRPNRIDETGLRYITNEFNQTQEKTELRAGDLLTVQSGHIGETAVVPPELDGANCHALIITRLKPKEAAPEFYSQYFNSEIGRARLRGLEVGSTILHINTKDLKKFRVPLPPLPEQKKIAEILSTWDRAIETAEKQLANAESQKRALMRQLLTGKRRLPGFEGEWKTRRLGELAEIDSESLSDSTDPEFCFRYISLTDVSGGRIEMSLPRIKFGSAPSRARRVVRAGDILFATVRPNLLGHARVPRCFDGEIASTGFAVVRPSQELAVSFVYHLMFSEVVGRQVHRLIAGSNYPAITAKDVRAMTIHWPSPAEQTQIGAVLDSGQRECDGLQVTLTKLRTEKRALMQQLLTGKRRVTV